MEALSDLEKTIGQLKLSAKNNEHEEKKGEYPYLFRFRTPELDFRLAEIQALVELFGWQHEFKYSQKDAQISASPILEVQSPFLHFFLPSSDCVKKICSRSVGVHAGYEALFEASSYDDLVAIVEKNIESAFENRPFKTFKFEISPFGKKYTGPETLKQMDRFKHINFFWKYQVDLSKPDVTFCVMEDFGSLNGETLPMKRVFFALKIADGNMTIVENFSLKKRVYLGMTSMDPELSFYMANQAHAKEGDLIYDPFGGTGSLLLVCAQFGATTMGSDIDRKSLLGSKDKNPFKNFQQQSLQHKLLDLLLSDSSHPPFRDGFFFDAIVTDPPYGVREGSRKIGKKSKVIKREQKHLNEGKLEFIKPPPVGAKYKPMCVNYPVPDMMKDLLHFSAKYLVLGGRLVYWLPTTDQYKDSDLPLHPCLKVVANSEQILSTRHRRRLITMKKIEEFNPEIHTNISEDLLGQFNPAHKNLRDYWFRMDEESIATKSEKSGTSSSKDDDDDDEME